MCRLQGYMSPATTIIYESQNMSSSTLVQAIRFRMLVGNLSDSEFLQFTARIVALFGRNILLTSILSRITDTKASQLDAQTVDRLISTIKEIINARDDESESSRANSTTLDELPGPLVGEISSYLKQKEFASFCRGSRSIFVGCSEYASVYFSCTNCLKKMHVLTIQTDSAQGAGPAPCLRLLPCEPRKVSTGSSHQNEAAQVR